MANEIQIDLNKTRGVTGIIDYRGYQIVDRDEYVVIVHDGGMVQAAHTPEQAKANIDEMVQARHAANFKKMGRHEPKETDLI
jgi:hypothetical protein